ncbi:MAG: phosphatase PAP2 family protein [Patescibacteria group bacterium]
MNSFDYSLFQIINGLARQNKFLDGLAIFLADYFQYLLIILAIFLFFLKEKNWRRLIFVGSVFALSVILARGLITEIFRFFYSRPRPFIFLDFSPLVSQNPTGSFPSGHMTFYFVLALTVFLINKKWGWFFAGSVILMGLARIFVGVHWPSDILGGILIAVISYFLIKKILPCKIS